MAEKIEGFYLDGTEYKFEGGGTEYNAGEGIAIGTIHSDMQGPAPDGFHVPLTTEWQGLKTIMDGLDLTIGDEWRINLYMPFAGDRYYGDASVDVQEDTGIYWSSSYADDAPDSAGILLLNSTDVDVDNYGSRSNGYSVRCFKDSYETPTSSWTVIRGDLGGAGIFWNQSEGLISITDGTTGYTMQDKNLGATIVYNDGDELSEANCGKYYQWGNNYGFARTGSVTTSSTQVDASNYGPGNYYSSSTFITSPTFVSRNWSSAKNDNLRGGVSQGTWIGGDGNTIVNTGVLSVNGQTGDVTITAGNGIDITNDEIGLDGTYEKTDYSAMQGPCPDGFHVPLSTEWKSIYDAGVSLGAWNSSNGVNFATYLKIPMAGYRDYSNVSFNNRGSCGCYWSSTPYTASYARRLLFSTSSVYPQDSYNRSFGFSVRCLQDSPTIPTSSWTILYKGSGSAGIYHNATDGLISISSDGTTWYTLMDKNLGATTVYNYGYTLTEANCGKIYQRGNNYGFSGDANYDVSKISKSSTPVNVTGYGPGNYYESSTWITTTIRQSSASDGNNLRGGETGIQTETGNLIIGDKLYKIVTSTTAPASGTANNIITFVTA